MKKLISVLIILVLAFAMCGCSFYGTGAEKINIDLEKVRQHKGTLLEVTAYPQGPMRIEDYRKENYTQWFFGYDSSCYIYIGNIDNTDLRTQDKHTTAECC